MQEKIEDLKINYLQGSLILLILKLHRSPDKFRHPIAGMLWGLDAGVLDKGASDTFWGLDEILESFNLSNENMLTAIIEYTKKQHIAAFLSPTYGLRIKKFFDIINATDINSIESLQQATNALLGFANISYINLMDCSEDYSEDCSEDYSPEAEAFDIDTILISLADFKERDRMSEVLYWALVYKHHTIVSTLFELVDFTKPELQFLLRRAGIKNDLFLVSQVFSQAAKKHYTFDEFIEGFFSGYNSLPIVNLLLTYRCLGKENIYKGLTRAFDECLKRGSYMLPFLNGLLLSSDPHMILSVNLSLLEDFREKVASYHGRFVVSELNNIISNALENEKHMNKFITFLSSENTFFNLWLPKEIMGEIAAQFYQVRPHPNPLVMKEEEESNDIKFA